MTINKQRLEKLEKQTKPQVNMTWKAFITADAEIMARYNAETKARGEMTWSEFIAGVELEGIIECQPNNE